MIQLPAKRASNQFVINAAEFLALAAVSTFAVKQKNKEVAFYALVTGGIINGSAWTRSETARLSMQDGIFILLVQKGREQKKNNL